MNKFLKYFFIGFAAQMLFLFLFLFIGAADGVVYILYMLPFAFLSLLIPIPQQICSEKSVACFFSLLTLPAAVYSVIFALIVVVIGRLTDRRR